MKKITYKWFAENKQKIFNGKSPQRYYVLSDELEVSTGELDDCDKDYCIRNDIPIYNLGRCGGTIVHSKGSLGVALLTDVKDGWKNNYFLEAFSLFLKKKGLNAEIDNNDILVDGYKVSSAAEWIVGENMQVVFGVYLFSLEVDVEAIRNVCKKEYSKEPKSLKSFGISESEVMEWCNNFFTRYK